MAQCVKVLAPKLDDLYSISKVPHGGKTDSYKMSCEFHMGITPLHKHTCVRMYTCIKIRKNIMGLFCSMFPSGSVESLLCFLLYGLIQAGLLWD